jgi:hypothetical protein
MRLLNFYTSGGVADLGVVQGSQVLDLTAARGDRLEFASLSSGLRVTRLWMTFPPAICSVLTSRGSTEELQRLWAAWPVAVDG